MDDTLTDPTAPPRAAPDPEGPIGSGGPGTGSARTTPPPLELVRAVEDAESLDPVVEGVRPLGDALSRGALGDLLGGAHLGHALHPTLTDLPIGCWTSTTLLDLLGGRRSRVAARRLTAIGLLAVVPTALTGWSDHGRIRQQRDRRVAVVHAAGNTAAALLHYRSWRCRRRGRHVRGAAWALAGNALVGGSAYLGGHLALGHGEGTGERTSATPSGT